VRRWSASPGFIARRHQITLAGKAELLTGIEAASSRPVRCIVLLG